MGPERPFIVIWEMTRACDLACIHCRAEARPWRSPEELTTLEAEALIDEVRQLQPPVFVLTGGDPLQRPDTFHLLDYAVKSGLRVSMSPSATPLLTEVAVKRLAEIGLSRMALSLDGSTAERHDAFRGVEGSFARTVAAAGWSRAAGLDLQINSSLTRASLPDLDDLAAVVTDLQPQLWSVFFVVPTGRAGTDDMLTAAECESVFARLYSLSQRVPFGIKTTEAMHYRRYCVQQEVAARRAGAARSTTPSWMGRQSAGRSPRPINDGKGFVFISHTGDVCPSGFLPVAAGNIRHQRLGDVYAAAPLFRALRDTSRLGGKCRVCEYREICGGSRARAYAVTGDPLAEDPACAYVPEGYGAAAS